MIRPMVKGSERRERCSGADFSAESESVAPRGLKNPLRLAGSCEVWKTLRNRFPLAFPKIPVFTSFFPS